MSPEQMDQLIEKLVQKLVDEGYLTVDQRRTREQGGQGQPKRAVKFEVTDKSVDFLGFKTLKDLLGSLGKASFGAHDTRELATGVETSGSRKQYEFGDTMNLDISETLFSAVRREGLGVPINLEYNDLHVHQCEYQSSCATVLMLDCSHSMILYGEDRFTPAKKVALALAHLIQTQYPGDSLRCVLFHDRRRRTRDQPAGARAGGSLLHQHPRRADPRAAPSPAGTEGHEADHHDHGRQAFGLTLDDGRMYRNAFGLDPLVISKTFEEVGRCKKQGILINTFMLASDYGLVQFRAESDELCKGKAYFTTRIISGSIC